MTSWNSLLSALASRVRRNLLRLVNDKWSISRAQQAIRSACFFQTRDGLWVSDNFKDRILPKAKPIETLDGACGKSFDLRKSAYDGDIVPELPKSYIFDESELCARIAQMIEKQPNGAKGDLLENNSDWNIFYVTYVSGYVVSVHWDSGHGEWHVNAWRVGGFDWTAGYRVFSRA